MTTGVTVQLIIATADDPRLALSVMKGRVCAVELVKDYVTNPPESKTRATPIVVQLGQAHTFRIGRRDGKESLACTADLAALPESWAGVTVGGFTVSGTLE